MADGRPSISSRRCRRPPATYPGRLERVTPCPLLVLLQVGFAKPLRSPGALVRSYRTVSPLLDPATDFAARSGGLLSVALSAGRPAWALPSTLPCGARTFLNPEHVGAAVAWPTAALFYCRDARVLGITRRLEGRLWELPGALRGAFGPCRKRAGPE